LSKSDQYDLVSGTNSRMTWWFLFISGYLILHSFNLFNPTSYTLVYLLFIFSFLAVVLVNAIFPKNLPDYFQVCVLLPNIMSCCLLLYHSQFCFHNCFFRYWRSVLKMFQGYSEKPASFSFFNFIYSSLIITWVLPAFFISFTVTSVLHSTLNLQINIQLKLNHILSLL